MFLDTGRCQSTSVTSPEATSGVAGEAILVKAGPTFEEVARNQIGDERTLASYAVGGTSLALRTESALY